MPEALSDDDIHIAYICACECAFQESGELSVFWMMQAWRYAQRMGAPIVMDDLFELARLVEPAKNERGFRNVHVHIPFGEPVADWRDVPRLLSNLLEADGLTPGEWFREFERIHPFVDGNGRVGQILFNWLSGSLFKEPKFAPRFDEAPRVAPIGAREG